MEDECFPAISMKSASGQLQHDPLTIKEEASSDTDSNHSSSPSSPHSIYVNASDIPLDVDVEMVSHIIVFHTLIYTLLLTQPSILDLHLFHNFLQLSVSRHSNSDYHKTIDNKHLRYFPAFNNTTKNPPHQKRHH